MTNHDDERVHAILQQILEFELAGVIRFTHYALMVRGPHRIPIVDFFQQQATESLAHAQRAGEILTGLGGHPSMAVAPVQETHQHSVQAILEESYAHEVNAIEMYKQLVSLTEGNSVFLEEYARSMVAAEEEHVMELRKMVRDTEV
jgi:bacterioferritin